MSNNHLSKDKQIAVTAALAEGNSIRSIERMTGVHRDTIMRLGVRVGQGCAQLLDQKMRKLDCNRIVIFAKVADLLADESPNFIQLPRRSGCNPACAFSDPTTERSLDQREHPSA